MTQLLQRFWADPKLPYLELRATRDGRSLCYGLHSHAEFSVGLIESGRSIYRNGRLEQAVGAGDLVLMNPGAVHACRSQDGEQAWAYSMLYVDPDWLAGVQGEGAWRDLPATLLRRADLAAAMRDLLNCLDEPLASSFEREQLCLDFFAALCEAARPPTESRRRDAGPDGRLRLAIELLQDRYAEPLRLADLAQAAGLSANQLTRLFRARTGLTPHAYLTDLRVQRSRALLRQGSLSLAEVALATGFADQAHWQRHYRRLHATPPGAYRRELLRARARPAR